MKTGNTSLVGDLESGPLPLILAIMVIEFSIFVMCAWLLQLDYFIKPYPDLPATSIVTAILLILTSSSLVVSLVLPSRIKLFYANALALAALLLIGINLALLLIPEVKEFVVGERLLVSSYGHRVVLSSPQTCFLITLVVCSQLLRYQGGSFYQHGGYYLNVVVLLLLGVICWGYIFEQNEIYWFENHIGIAVPTTFALALLGQAQLFAIKQETLTLGKWYIAAPIVKKLLAGFVVLSLLADLLMIKTNWPTPADARSLELHDLFELVWYFS